MTKAHGTGRYRRRHHLFGVGAGYEETEIGRNNKVNGKDGSGSVTSWSGPLPHNEARCDEGVDGHDSTSEMTASCRIVGSTTAIIPRDENRQPDCGRSGGSSDGLWARLSACYRPFESSGCGRCHDVSDGNSSEEHADDAIVAKSTALPPATTAEDVASAMQHIFIHGVVHYCLNRSSATGGDSATGDCSLRQKWNGYQPLAPTPWEGAIGDCTAGQDSPSLPLSPIQSQDAKAIPPPSPSPSSVCRSFCFLHKFSVGLLQCGLFWFWFGSGGSPTLTSSKSRHI